MNQRLQHIVEHYDEMCIGTDEHFFSVVVFIKNSFQKNRSVGFTRMS